MNFNLQDIVKKLVKYLVEGIIVSVTCFAIPQKSLQIDEIAVIGLIAAATFSILDVFLPTMGQNARTGAAFGIGANLVKFPGGF
jgi:hypothetical protein